VIHRNIVLFRSLFLLLLILDFKLRYLHPEHLLPFFTKCLHIYKLIILNARIKVKHRRVSVSKLEIKFTHLPFEIVFVELREVPGYDSNKLGTDFCKFGVKIIAIEFERTVHDSTVVESGHSK
jgi:hypothetical protein